MNGVVTLVGYRATGKSTVGQSLAKRLGWSCADSDVEAEAKAGRTIAEIFSESGEAEFRRLERETIASLLRRDGLVLSTGGGAILNQQTRRNLKAAGPVVWLQASVETILSRLSADPTTEQRRPSLTDHEDQRTEITEVLEQRKKLYAEAATIVIDTNELSSDSVTEAAYKEVAIALGRGDRP